MKTLVVLLFLMFTCHLSNAQQGDSTLYRIVKTDGGELIGYIIKQDEREMEVATKDKRIIIIPQYIVKEIVAIDERDFSNKGEYVGEDKFATRYFITTNGLPLKKGEHYIQWNLFGPDFQFAVSNNFGVGIMTTWFAVPIIATAKYSFKLSDKSQFAVGTMIGTTSWISLLGSDKNAGGALPFGTYSFGDRRANVAVSGGYGAIWAQGDTEGRALFSVAGMVKVSAKISVVFDSFIVTKGKTTTRYETVDNYVYNANTGMYENQMLTNKIEDRKPGLGLFIPGIRWHQSEGKAFQFGFSGVSFDGELLPVPVPMVQWYRSL